MLAKTGPGRHPALIMKNVIGVVILAIVCIGLGAMLFSTKQRAEAEKQKDVEVILNHSNQWVKTSLELDEQQQVNQMLTNDLTATRAEFAKLTNKFTEVVGTLGQTEASLRASQSAVAERDAKISALENQNRELDEKAVDLSASLANLTLMIAETERKLEASEGDKAFLEGELKRLMAEKAELERQFNDLAILRAQVSRLREELSIARRLDWIRRGILGADETKGATRLMNPRTPTPAPTPSQYDLNVEIDSDGTVKVIPPLTNTPATNP
jgi:septal ring factor EnvC (AmiA/AmiB activator)